MLQTTTTTEVSAKKDRLWLATTTELPEEPPALVMSADLYQAYENTRNPHPNVGLPRSYLPAVRAEAATAVAMLRPFADPPEPAVVRLWLAPVLAALREVPTPEHTAGLVQGVLLAAAEAERGAFTAKTQRTALRTFRQMPAAADVLDVIADAGLAITTKLNILLRIATA